jgi:dihydroflavonol-4-reductase
VRDVAEGIIGAAERGLIGQRYVLGAHNLTLQDLLSQLSVVTGVAVPRWKVPYGLAWTTSAIAELLSNFTGTAPIAPMAGVRLARSCLQFDCSKFHKELNVDPRSVGETLTDLVHWFRINGYLDGERQAK